MRFRSALQPARQQQFGPPLLTTARISSLISVMPSISSMAGIMTWPPTTRNSILSTRLIGSGSVFEFESPTPRVSPQVLPFKKR
jgi:hypothetical protein